MKSIIGLFRALIGAFPWALSMIQGWRVRKKDDEIDYLTGKLKRKEVEDEVDDLSDVDRVERLRKWEQQ